MFSTRLNPTKPPAAYRAILERVGAGCRKIRPIEDECSSFDRVAEQSQSILTEHGVLGIGVPASRGGVGDDPLLIAMTAERIGREGLRLVRWFAEHVANVANRPAGSESSANAASVQDDTADVEFRYRLNLTFCWSAGRIGVIADCLETVVAFCGESIRGNGSVQPDPAIERLVAELASGLEATRAITYAAAELKAELDRHPNSKHLRLETGTLVAEAYAVSAKSLSLMVLLTRATTVGGSPVVACLPPRHRLFVERAKVAAEPDEWVESQIARYYLFE